MNAVYEIKLDVIALARKYAGKWVAMRPDTYEVIASGTSAEEVLAAAERAGVEEPLIADVVESYGSHVPCLHFHIERK
jgi:hypothetical protein